MSYWKTKVLPKIKKFLDGKGGKKAAALFTKKFDAEKETYGKDIDEKVEEFQPKLVEIYKDSSPETQAVLKDPTEESLKENPEAIQALLVKLGAAGVPGAQILSEATGKFGVGHLPEPVLFILKKVQPFVADEPAPVLPAPAVVEVASREIEIPAPVVEETPAAAESSTSKEVEVSTPAAASESTPAAVETKSEAPAVAAEPVAPVVTPAAVPPAAVPTPAPTPAATPAPTAEVVAAPAPAAPVVAATPAPAAAAVEPTKETTAPSS